MNKFSFLATFGLLAASAVSALNASPLLRYEFKEAGVTQSSTGSAALNLSVVNYNGTATNYVTTTPKQRDGTDNNYALNFSASNVDTGVPAGNQTKGVAKAVLNDANAGFLRGDLESFTISAWVSNIQFDNNDPNNRSRRLFSLRNAAGQQIVDFMIKADNDNWNSLQLGLTGSLGQKTVSASTLTIPMGEEDWFFVSVSYDAETGMLNFYLGEEGGTLTSFSGNNLINGGVNTLLGNATLLGIGNVDNNHQRRLDGYISDIRFYGEALTAQQITEIYSIPEPGTVAILGLGAIMAGLPLLKRLK